MIPALELGATRIYVLPTGHACSLEEPPGGALAMALHAISLLTQRRTIDDIERHRGHANLIVLPPPCPLGTQPIDFDHAEALIARTLTNARAFLDSGGEARPPIRMRVHRHGDAVEMDPAERQARTGTEVDGALGWNARISAWSGPTMP